MHRSESPILVRDALAAMCCQQRLCALDVDYRRACLRGRKKPRLA